MESDDDDDDDDEDEVLLSSSDDDDDDDKDMTVEVKTEVTVSESTDDVIDVSDDEASTTADNLHVTHRVASIVINDDEDNEEHTSPAACGVCSLHFYTLLINHAHYGRDFICS